MAVAAARLPRSFAPMLATPGAPFDSERHLYEVKWDGIRAVTLAEGGGYRLLSRRGNDLTGNYPELAALARLPAGTVVDGEIVVLNEGLPDFELALRRDRGSSRAAARGSTPAIYLVFDVMYRSFAPITELPLLARREPLSDLVERCESGHVALSDGFVGAGVPFYREVCRRNLEGVVAKRVDSRYLPGRRSDAWDQDQAPHPLPLRGAGLPRQGRRRLSESAGGHRAGGGGGVALRRSGRHRLRCRATARDQRVVAAPSQRGAAAAAAGRSVGAPPVGAGVLGRAGAVLRGLLPGADPRRGDACAGIRGPDSGVRRVTVEDGSGGARLRDREVAFAGRLASMTRQEAGTRVAEAGGRVVREPGANTAYLVVGHGGWPLRADGRPSSSMARARRLKEQRAALNIVSETTFLQILGLTEKVEDLQRLFTTAQLSRILEVPAREIRAWMRRKLIRPVKVARRLAWFDFREVAMARALHALTSAGVSPTRIGRSIRELAQWLPDAQGAQAMLTQLETFAHGPTLSIRLQDGRLADPGGQLLLDFHRDAARPLGRRRHDPCLRPATGAGGGPVRGGSPFAPPAGRRGARPGPGPGRRAGHGTRRLAEPRAAAGRRSAVRGAAHGA